jgi:hypothetical protein
MSVNQRWNRKNKKPNKPENDIYIKWFIFQYNNENC